MSAADTVSNALLLLGVLIAPFVMFSWMSYHLGKAISTEIARRKKQHFLSSLPCSRCRYLSDCESLQCAVNPTAVFTTDALTCCDFAEKEIETAYAIKREKRYNYPWVSAFMLHRLDGRKLGR